MKEIVIISGKGGTGKTTLVAGFASLARKAVFADCDVDAADLYLLLHPQILERHYFKGGYTAQIEEEKCIGCRKCKEVCRFEAIIEEGLRKKFRIDPFLCEGCGLCKVVCPQNAIKTEEEISGEWFISETRFGPLVHAKLFPAEENSGKLVSLVKAKAQEIAEKKNFDWIIIDGSPGIGCPVIASLTGASLAIVVTEPTLSGLHDAQRIIGVAFHFGVPTKLIINKFDLNEEMTKKIENWCYLNNIPVIGKIRFEKKVVEAMIEAKTIVEYKDSEARTQIIQIWENLKKHLV